MVKYFGLKAVSLAILLTGCMQTGGGSARFLGGDILIAPVAGYCVNQRASAQNASARGDRAVALIGKCASSDAAEAALITVSLGEKGSGLILAEGPQALARHLQTTSGRASLARDGRAASVRLSQMILGQDQLIFHVQDRRAGPHWRAILSLKGRLTSVSVQDPQGASLAQGRALLERSVAALRRANPAS